MKTRFHKHFKKSVITISLLLLAIFFLAVFYGNGIFIQLTKLITFLVLFLFFFAKYKMIGFAFLLFSLFSLFGSGATFLFDNGFAVKESNVFYAISYCCLIHCVMPQLKFNNIDRIIGLYFVLVFSIASFFIYTLASLLSSILLDGLEVLSFSFKSLSLALLVLVSFVNYLTKQTEESIVFLLTSIFFLFSNMLLFTAQYYIYHWSIAFLEQVLQVFGLLMCFKYGFDLKEKLHKEIVDDSGIYFITKKMIA